MLKKSLKIFCGNPHSKGGKALAEALGIKRLLHDSDYRPANATTIINWGAAGENFPQRLRSCGGIVNHPNTVAIMSNKATAFQRLAGRGITPEAFYNDIEAAAYRERNGNPPFIVRNILTGHSGNGIIYVPPEEPLPAGAPLYVQYIKKAAEYRVHIFNHNLKFNSFFVQRKARRKDIPDEQVNWKVRNHDNGFIYANDPTNVGKVPDIVLQQAANAMRRAELNFGAVDVVYNKKHKMAFVLEINTAPGLEGQTLEYYATKMRERFDLTDL